MKRASVMCVEKILVIFPKRLGDALMCTPALKVLADCFPTATIDALAESALGGVVASRNPHVNKVLVEPSEDQLRDIAKGYQLGVNLHCAVNHDRDFLKLLKTENTDLRAVYPVDQDKAVHQSAHNIRSLANQLKTSLDVDDMPYEFLITENDRLSLRERLQSQGVDVDKQHLVVFQLGCHGIQKNAKPWKFWKKMGHKRTWNWERFWTLECKLRKHDPNITIVLQGAGKERLLVEQYQRKSTRAVGFVDAGIEELAALLEKCDCLVTPDTGTMHLGCAMGSPMVAMFGPTSPACTGPHPLREDIKILKGASLEDISVDSVCAAVCELLPIQPEVE